MGNMTAYEWAAKAEYEGGVIDAFEYGLKPDDLDDNAPEEFRGLVEEAYDGYMGIQEVLHELEVEIEDLLDGNYVS